MIEPTVGRSLWYYPGFHETTMHTPNDAPCAAIIARVIDSQTLNLAVFSPDGQACSRRSVHLRQGGTAVGDATDAYASWMPFQIGQAKK